MFPVNGGNRRHEFRKDLFMSGNVHVVGVGMIPFAKPGASKCTPSALVNPHQVYVFA